VLAVGIHIWRSAVAASSIPITRTNAGNWWQALVASATFAVLAYTVRGVTRSGSVVGACICFLLYVTVGFRALALLLIVFILTWLTTRFGYSSKQRMGTAEARTGRTGSQVLANLGVATACAVLYALEHHAVFILAMSAAFSEAAADTVSSEIGQAARNNAYLITTWKAVPAGTNGGISLPGTIGGISAAAIVSLFCATSALLSWKWSALSALAGALGMIADSFLGALLEQRRLLSNNAVNFLGTLVAAITGALLA
jgi:uncharacterized protein (TIGR00297 family)